MVSLPQARPQPTPAAIVDYCQTHSNAQAATHFGLNERTIRKMKARARAGQEAITPNRNPPSVTGSRPASADQLRRFATVQPGDIAHAGQLWKCPICGELMPPLPGTTGEQWAKRGCYMHQAEPAPARPTVEILSIFPARPTDPAPPLIASQTPGTTGPTRPLSTTYTAGPAPLVITRTVRHPTPERSAGLVAWTRTHEILSKQLAAWVIVAGLILLCTIGR